MKPPHGGSFVWALASCFIHRRSLPIDTIEQNSELQNTSVAHCMLHPHERRLRECIVRFRLAMHLVHLDPLNIAASSHPKRPPEPQPVPGRKPRLKRPDSKAKSVEAFQLAALAGLGFRAELGPAQKIQSRCSFFGLQSLEQHLFKLPASCFCQFHVLKQRRMQRA